jgi:hypothetical protein
MALIRKCMECGTLDKRATWSSADEAAKDGGLERWTCSTCAWTEFELVDTEQEAEPARS